MTKILKGMRIEIDGRRGVIRHLTADRCWVLHDGDLVATGYSISRARRSVIATEGADE
jgi:hypothetical protein